jgi:NADH:ubiquinone oxidoreductase subunit K
MVPLSWYMMLSAIVFAIGVFGFLSRKNVIVIFMSIELMLNAVNINLISMSHYLQDLRGQILAFFVVAVAAAEAAIGLAIIVALFRNKATANVEEVKEMQG